MIGTRLLRLGAMVFIGALLATGISAAPAPASPAATAAAAVPGLEYVYADSSHLGTSGFPGARYARVDCPAGKRVIGAAASVIDQVPAALSWVAPSRQPALRFVVAWAVAVPLYSAATWRVRAHAICANPLPGLQLVVAISDPDSRSAKGISALCPSGKKLVGSGGAVDVRARGLEANRAVLDEIAPYPNLNGVGVVGVETAGGTSADWTHTAYAICANPLPGLQLLQRVGPAAAVPERAATTFCPQGKSLLSPAGNVNAAAPGRSVWRSTIIGPAHSGRGAPPGPAVSVVGRLVPPNLQHPWSVTSFAICANT